MSILDRFGFGKSRKVESESTFEGEAQATTGEELLRLAESNQTVVGAELEEFETRVAEIMQQAEIGGGMRPEDWNLVRQTAIKSAEALSGYGIIVTAESFMETLD